MLTVLLHGTIDIVEAYLADRLHAGMLTGRKVQASLGVIDVLAVVLESSSAATAPCLVVPVADVDDVDGGSQGRVIEDAVLYVLRGCEGYEHMVAGLLFPVADGLHPEAGEMQGSCIFLADVVDDVI